MSEASRIADARVTHELRALSEALLAIQGESSRVLKPHRLTLWGLYDDFHRVIDRLDGIGVT